MFGWGVAQVGECFRSPEKDKAPAEASGDSGPASPKGTSSKPQEIE